MNEMRRDPVTRKWIIVERDGDVEKAISSLKAAVTRSVKNVQTQPLPCDFCPGQEAQTPPSIMEYDAGNFRYQKHEPQWQVRVVPNRNPVFRIEGNLDRRPVAGYDVMDALGAHEIIIEHREHRDWDEVPLPDIAAIVAVYRERMNDLSKDERFGHLFIFKNHGSGANSSVAHPHSTLIASPSVPERIRRELDYTRKHYLVKERCLFCDIIKEEVRRKGRSGLVKQYDNFVTISPYFASHPLETWMLPRKHDSNFKNLSTGSFTELATVLQENLRTVKKIVGPLSYTLLLFSRPNKIWGGDRDYWTTIDSDYHWHFKFLPRFPRQSGFHRSFSAGSGFMINQVPPEAAAALLRAEINSTPE
jgi:UDPglucose--hexose-1-phosphate uridylyltransferase